MSSYLTVCVLVAKDLMLPVQGFTVQQLLTAYEVMRQVIKAAQKGK